MNDMIKMITRFRTQEITAEEYINLNQIVLIKLKELHPIFETIYSWGKKPSSWTMIEKNFGNFSEVVFDHIYDPDINYKNQDKENNDFSMLSKSWAGFSNSYSNTKNEKNGKFTVSIGAGGESGVGFINFEFPQVNYPEFYNRGTLEQLLAELIKIVDLDAAYIYTKAIYDQVVDYDKEYDLEIGWVNYFKNKNVFNFIPSNISQKEFCSGALFWLSEDFLAPPQTVIENAIVIRDRLGAEGFLN